uniref:Uncharacterized protein n=1 Tax=Laticauda laticaudata TaxID=8630 RepID=A0A8C5SX56_LATLA
DEFTHCAHSMVVTKNYYKRLHICTCFVSEINALLLLLVVKSCPTDRNPVDNVSPGQWWDSNFFTTSSVGMAWWQSRNNFQASSIQIVVLCRKPPSAAESCRPGWGN